MLDWLRSNTGDLFQIHRLAFIRLLHGSAASNSQWTETRQKIWGKTRKRRLSDREGHGIRDREGRKKRGWGRREKSGVARQFKRGDTDRSGVWSAVADKHARSTPCAPPLLVLARRQMLCGSAAGGARSGEAAETAASLARTLTWSRWISRNLQLSPSHLPPPPTTSLSSFCLCLSADGFLQALPSVTWMSRYPHHHHLHHHLPQLSRRAASPWRSELDTQCFASSFSFLFFFVVFGKWMWGNRCPARRWWSCRDLAAALLHVKGVKEKKNLGNISIQGIKILCTPQATWRLPPSWCLMRDSGAPSGFYCCYYTVWDILMGCHMSWDLVSYFFFSLSRSPKSLNVVFSPFPSLFLPYLTCRK